MKKFMIMLLSMLLLAANLVCAGADALPDYEKIMQELKDMPKDEFTSALLVSGNNISETGEYLHEPPSNQVPFMYAATAFMQRSAEFTNDEIVEMATNTKNGIYMRDTAVQVFSQKNNYKVDDLRLIAMLDDPETPETLKINIIVSCPFTYPEGKQYLKDLFASSEGTIAFHALKKLSAVDLADAIKIADSTIASYKQEDEQKVCAAIKAKSRQFESPDQTFKTSVDKDSFIEFCEIFYAEAKEMTSKDTAIFALSDLGDEAAVKKIMSNESADNTLKVHTVSKNEEVLKEMLADNPTDEELAAVAQAMSIFPSEEIAKILEVTGKLYEKLSSMWTAAVSLFPGK